MFNVLLRVMLLYLIPASASFGRQQELSNMSFMTESYDIITPPPKRPRVDLTLDHRPQIISIQLIKPADSAINKTTPNCMENNVHPNNLDISMQESEPQSIKNFGAIDCVPNVLSNMHVHCNAICQKTDSETESLTHANPFYTTQCVPASNNLIALLEQNSHKALIHNENPIDTTLEQTFLHKTSVTDQNSKTLCNASDENDNAENLLKIIADIPYLELVGLIEKVCERAREKDSSMINNDLLLDTCTDKQHCQEPDFWSSEFETILGKVKEGITILSFELFNEQTQRVGNVALKINKSWRKNMYLELDEYKNLVHTSTNVLNLEYSDFLYICKLPECLGLHEKLSKMMEISATNQDNSDLNTTDCNLGDKMKNQKCFESCNELEKLIAELHYDFLGVKPLETLYLGFITHMCLDYNTNLGCYILKERLWKIHVYMPEFYFYILWKLKRLDIDYRKIKNNICSYKEHLVDEMQYIGKIINLSDSIENSEIDLVTYQKLIENVYNTVDKFRYHIVKYLANFHTRESSTTLYFLAYKMRGINHEKSDSSNTVSSNFREWDGDCLYAAAISRIKEGQLKETGSKKKEQDPVCFQKLHRAKMTKNTIFVCAFTVMIPNQKLFVWDDATFIGANRNVKGLSSPSRFFLKRFYGRPGYGKAIDAALLNVLVYITFLKNQIKPNANAQTSTYTPKPFDVEKIHEQILKMSGLSNSKKLILYRDLILDAMMA